MVNNWSYVSLGDICEIKGGKRLPKGSNLTKAKTKHPYIKVKNMGIKKNIALDDNFEYLKPDIQKEISKYIVNTNDLIISIVGTIGLISKIDNSLEKANLTENCVKLINMQRVTSDYLYYFLSSNYGQHEIDKNIVGAVQKKLPIKNIKKIQLPLPSLKEQKAIAKILSSLDEKIEVNNRMNEILENMAQDIFKRWFVDFEFPNADGEPYKSSGGKMVESELGLIPEGWEVQMIKDFTIKMQNGGTPRRKKENYWNHDDYPWIKTGEIKNKIIIDAKEHISKEGLKNSSAKITPKNSVLIALYGATAGQIGFLKFESTTNQACCSMICNSVNKSIFLYLFLLHNQEYISSLANGAAQQNLSKETISKLKVIVPSDSFFRELIFDSLFLKIENNLRESKQLSKIRDTLLPKLISGEIRVPIKEEETEG
jgi:type I restriction enzyme S subunit